MLPGYKWSIFIFILASEVFVSARDAKWFFSKNTITHFVHARLEASSCMVVEESLRPCRYIRHIKPSSSYIPQRMLMTAAPMPPRGPPLPPPLRGSVGELTPAPTGSWGWMGEVTVTHTITHRAMPPPPVVSFTVRGCKPSRLPLGLPLCSTTNVTANINSTTQLSRITPALHSIQDL